MAEFATGGGDFAAFCESYLRHTKGRWAGRPFVLESWQRAFADELFRLDADGRRVYRFGLLGVPRKNGKSSFAAATSLYLLAADGEAGPEVYSAAASRDQARVVFQQAREFVEGSPGLAEFLRVQRSDIANPDARGIYRVISADGRLQHGLNPSGVSIDELWAHKDAELLTALTTGSGAREQPLAVALTTAGWERDSVLGEMYDRAMAQPDVERPTPFHTIARDRENGFLFVWYGAGEDADPDDPVVWEGCNPASWMTADYLREQRWSPQMRLNDFLRFHLNAWTDTEEAWVSPEAWDACRGDVQIPDDALVYLGIDIGRRKDSTAIVAAAMVEEKLHVRAHIRLPSPLRPVAIADARADVAKLAGEYRLAEAVYDPFLFQESAEMLLEQGVPMVEMPQNDLRMAPASETLFELIQAGRVVHDGDAELRRQVLAAVPAQTERGVRISKRKSRKRIDGAVALAMAADRAVRAPAPYTGPLVLGVF